MAFLLLQTGVLLAQHVFGPDLFSINHVNRIDFTTDNDNLWKELEQSYRFKLTKKNYFLVSVSINGHQIDSVGLRFKGTHSNAFAWTDKKPLKVKLNEYKNLSYNQRTKFNLANAFEDPSFQRDIQSLYLLNKIGVAAPKAGYADVYLNGNLIGLYIIIEQLDETFLQHNFGESTGRLFESNGFCFNDFKNIDKNLEQKIGEKEGAYEKAKSLSHLLLEEKDVVFMAEIKKVFDVSAFIKSCAVDLYLANGDSYAWGRCHNFYLYENKNGLITWIPWDYNLSFGYDVAANNWGRVDGREDFKFLYNRILSVDKYRNLLYKNFDAIAKITSSRKFKRLVKRTKKLVRPSVQKDPNLFYGIDTFNISLKTEIVGGLTSKIPGLLQYTKAQNKAWKEFKKEKDLRIN